MSELYRIGLDDPEFATPQEACEDFRLRHGYTGVGFQDPPSSSQAIGLTCHILRGGGPWYVDGGQYTQAAITARTTDDPPFGGSGGGGVDGGTDGTDASGAGANPAAYGGGASTAGGPEMGIDGASSEWTRGVPVHGAALYPDYLPCPKSIVTTPSERRLLSDITGKRQSRGLQRDYLARERIEWPPLTQEQALIFKLWWRETLNRGGAWFATDHWPTPQGGTVHRRFVGEPQWRYIHGGTDKRMWTISAECEVSGRRV